MKRFIIIFYFLLSSYSYAQTVPVPSVVTTVSAPTFTFGQKTINNSPTLIIPSNINRKSLMIRNQGAADAYIGGSSVSVTSGLLLKTGEVIILDRSYAAWYAVVSSSSTTAGFVEER